MKKHPRVSVVMSVFNGAKFLREAMDSILNQTYRDFELIVVNDGSEDDTGEILASYDDERLVRLKNELNIGLTRSLNRGIQASRGKFIARQDADDLSLPERLELQVKHLESHPRVGLLGTGSRWIDENGGVIREWKPLTDNKEIQRRLLYSIPFLHGTFMFRRDCLDDIGGGYDENMTVAQDCDLLLKIGERWDLANLPDVLYLHRQHDKRITANYKALQDEFLIHAQNAAVKRRLKYGWSRLRLSRKGAPDWVMNSDRNWLAQRFVWWSASARQRTKLESLKFLLIAFFLDPLSGEMWEYIRGVIQRKLNRYIPFAGGRLRVFTR